MSDTQYPLFKDKAVFKKNRIRNTTNGEEEEDGPALNIGKTIFCSLVFHSIAKPDVEGMRSIGPGGFGSRGTEGMILAANYARENKIPFLGICLGMQMAMVAFARNVLGYADANSSELDPETTHPVVDLMPDQNGVENLGGTLRLGSYPCVLDKKSDRKSVV